LLTIDLFERLRYASGRPTAMVLDCGAAVTSVIPVYDGFVLKKGANSFTSISLDI